MRRDIGALALAVALVALAAPPAGASMVRKMDLSDLAERADRIFRGTVLSVEEGSVAAGGGVLPTVVYRLQVDEAFKGDYAATKGVAEITMLGSLKPEAPNGSVARLSRLPELPNLVRGGEYVLFTTPPSPVGLSTTVGLGQGAFKVYLSPDREEMAVNELNNAGLAEGIDGPVAYSELAGAIREEVAP
jgi:hypothetical protein